MLTLIGSHLFSLQKFSIIFRKFLKGKFKKCTKKFLFQEGFFCVILIIMSDEEIKKEEALPAEDVEVEEFEFNDDGEEDLKKTLKKFRADLKICKAAKEEYLTGWQKERAELGY